MMLRPATPPRRRHAPNVLLSIALLATLPLAAAPLAAHEFTGGDLELLHPNAPPTPPGVSSAAGYLVIVNSGDEDDRLTGGSAPFASGIEMHRTTVEDDVARMRRLDEGLVIPAGTTVRLDPGETHLMFTGLTEPLPDGEKRPATLVFERAGEIDVEFAIERPDTSGASGEAMDHDSMDHDDMNHGETDHGDMGHDETVDDATTSEPARHDDMNHDDMNRGDTNHDGTTLDAN